MARKSARKTHRHARSSAAAPQSRRSPLDLWICLGLAVVTFAIYFQVIGHHFIQLDDNEYITDNPIVARGLSWSGLVWAFTTVNAANWHPLTWLSHMADCQFFGLNAGAHLIVNVSLHVANTLLLYWFLRRATGAIWRSAIVAGLFALHPLHIESVAWASERKDTLSAFFGLLTLLAYLRYVEARSLLRFALVVLGLAFGLMAKSMLVTWPFVLLLLDFWPFRRMRWPDEGGWKRFVADLGPLFREKLLLLPLVGASIVMTSFAQARGGAVRGLADATFSLRFSNAVVSYVKYLGTTFWPSNLAVYYPFPPEGVPLWQVLSAVLLLGTITLATVLFARTHPYLITGWFWFLGTLLPVIGLVQVGGQAMADRYYYLPSIGLFFAIVFGLADLSQHLGIRRLGIAVAAVVTLGLCSTLTARQLGYWRDSDTLFRHTLAVTAENPPIHYNLGCVLAQAGRYEEALEHFDFLLHLDPNSPDALISKGAALSELGRLNEAVTCLQRATQAAPESPRAHTQLALSLVKQGREHEAFIEFRRAADLARHEPDAHANLGLSLARLGRTSEAEAEFNEALRLDPGNAEAHNAFGLVLLATGRIRESISHFSAALQTNPDHASARQNLDRAQAALGSSR